jgi:class 3 adenylate cyclase
MRRPQLPAGPKAPGIARQFVLFTLLYGGVAGAFFYWFYWFSTTSAIERLRDELRAVTRGTAEAIDEGELLALYRTGERDADGFSQDSRYVHQLDWFDRVHRLSPHAWPYTFVRGNQGDTRRFGEAVPDEEFVYVTDLNARHCPEKAAHFLEPDHGSPPALAAWSTGQLVERPGVYRDRWGSWLTDYAAIKDAHGTVVAVLGVDFDATYVGEVQGRVRRQLVPILGVSYVLLTALGLYAQRARSLRSLFGRYASLSLLRDGAQLKLGYARRRRVTVLFSDINDFSTLCEQHTPEEVIRMLNDYFAVMNDIIVASGGWIKQFVGDEIMVLYGAPDEHPEPERAAVEAAVRMVTRLRELEASATAPGFFRIKVGIHSGEVIVGNVGSHHRTEYAAVGDDVNLGSRIMGKSKALGATILVSSIIHEAAKDLPGVEFVDRGHHPVKGRQQQVQIYEVTPSKRPRRP